jgi:hypothetical protein
MPNSSTKIRIEPSPKMWPVLKKLKELGFWFTVCSPHHVKVGNVNYWPSSGCIFVDRAPEAFPERGLDALIQYLVLAKEAAQKKAIERNAGSSHSHCLTLSEI